MDIRQIEKDYFIKRLVQDPDGFRWSLWKGKLELQKFDYIAEAKDYYRAFLKED
jgi:hypothetical protein